MSYKKKTDVDHPSRSFKTGSCPSGKREFSSKAAAKKAIRRHHNKQQMRLYKCNYCGKIHLTSQPKGA